MNHYLLLDITATYRNGCLIWNNEGTGSSIVYTSVKHAVAALKDFADELRAAGHKDIYDFTNDGKWSCVEWTDKKTGKRHQRNIVRA